MHIKGFEQTIGMQFFGIFVLFLQKDQRYKRNGEIQGLESFFNIKTSKVYLCRLKQNISSIIDSEMSSTEINQNKTQLIYQSYFFFLFRLPIPCKFVNRTKHLKKSLYNMSQ